MAAQSYEEAVWDGTLHGRSGPTATWIPKTQHATGGRMYYEETILDGVLHSRTGWNEPWRAKTAQELTLMLIEARRSASAPQVVPQVTVPWPLPVQITCDSSST